METLPSLSSLPLVVEYKVIKGAYGLLTSSKETYREGYAKILNYIVRHEILEAIADKIYSFRDRANMGRIQERQIAVTGTEFGIYGVNRWTCKISASLGLNAILSQPEIIAIETTVSELLEENHINKRSFIITGIKSALAALSS